MSVQSKQLLLWAVQVFQKKPEGSCFGSLQTCQRAEKRQLCLFRGEGRSKGSSAFFVALMVDHCLSGNSHLKRRLVACQGRFLSGFKLQNCVHYFFSKRFFCCCFYVKIKCNMLFDTIFSEISLLDITGCKSAFDRTQTWRAQIRDIF